MIYNFAPASKAPRELFQQIDYLIVNEIEASLVAGRGSMDNPAEVAEMLSREHGITVVMTLGAEGAVAASGSQLVRLPAPAVDVVDTTGAGDTFAGGFMGYLASAGEITDAVITRGIIAGSALASFAVEGFGLERLMQLTPELLRVRFAEFRQLTYFDAL